MFSSTQSSQPQAQRPVPSLIGADVVIIGILQSEGDIQIDGRVDGNIRSAGLVIGASARVLGEIVADSVLVRGRVEGSIRARKIALAEGSHVEGDILHQSLEVEYGAYVQANLRHAIDPLAQILSAETGRDETVEAITDRRRPGSPMRGAMQEAAEDDSDMRKAG